MRQFYRNRFRQVALALMLIALPSLAAAENDSVQVFPRPALSLESLIRPMRGTLFNEAVQQHMATATAAAPYVPQAGDVVQGEGDRQATWTQLDEAAAAQPLPRELQGGYLFVTVEEPANRVAILSGSGVGLCYVNGQPHAGDLYRRGMFPTPVQLRKGPNHFLLLVAGDQPQVRLGNPAKEIGFAGPHTYGDFLKGPNDEQSWVGGGVCNATAKPATGLQVRATCQAGEPTVTSLPSIPPLTTMRVAFVVKPHIPKDLPLDRKLEEEEKPEMTVELLSADGEVLQSAKMRLRLADPFDTREPYRQTFRSNIDGSVQYYGVKQAATKPGDPPPAVIVTMHGASIEALSHLNHMGGKSWAHLVSPTNRGTYGFDYEDIGRKDALEALADAQQRFKHDPTRVYLSGHSMGGHGTWSIGSLYPNKFAAIGPSAGWISYWSYRGHAPFGDANPLEQILKRSMLASDVEQLSVNLKDRAVYVLHGNVDNNVPADQSRRMAEVLKEFHRDWTYAEEGGSHFWNSKESDSSTACVDWPEMLQCFARHVLPPDAAVRRIEFVTPNPRITSQMHWLTIHSQQRQGELSKVQAHCWPIKREFELTTDNVATLRLDTQHLRTEGPVNVRLDGQQVASSAPDDRGGVWFTRQGETWQATGPPSLKQKGPHRYGPVKEEVDRRFVVVYGTQGTPEENAAMLAKARYDAETYLSRANSSGEIVADTQFAPADYADRTVLLIGNADTNAAWNGLLADSAIKVRRGELQVGDQTFTGDDIATMFVQPRPDSDTASVVAFAGTGPVGMQLTYRWSLFVPFVRYPDCLAVQAAGPTAAPRTLAAGYFGNDWSVASGEFVFPSDSAP